MEYKWQIMMTGQTVNRMYEHNARAGQKVTKKRTKYRLFSPLLLFTNITYHSSVRILYKLMCDFWMFVKSKTLGGQRSRLRLRAPLLCGEDDGYFVKMLAVYGYLDLLIPSLFCEFTWFPILYGLALKYGNFAPIHE